MIYESFDIFTGKQVKNTEEENIFCNESTPKNEQNGIDIYGNFKKA